MVGMDLQSLALIFKATLEPASREAAEKQLTSVRKIINFGPLIAQVVANPSIDNPSRQAAAIHLKNLIQNDWDDPTEADRQKALDKGEPIPFSIHEQDRTTLRDQVLELVIESPEVLRAQMAVALENICKSDFPDKWTNVVQRVNFCLHSPQHELW